MVKEMTVGKVMQLTHDAKDVLLEKAVVYRPTRHTTSAADRRRVEIAYMRMLIDQYTEKALEYIQKQGY